MACAVLISPRTTITTLATTAGTKNLLVATAGTNVSKTTSVSRREGSADKRILETAGLMTDCARALKKTASATLTSVMTVIALIVEVYVKYPRREMIGQKMENVLTTVLAGSKNLHAKIPIVRRKEDSAKTVIRERVGFPMDNVETQTAVAG